jgi:hypothetical protein
MQASEDAVAYVELAGFPVTQAAWRRATHVATSGEPQLPRTSGLHSAVARALQKELMSGYFGPASGELHAPAKSTMPKGNDDRAASATRERIMPDTQHALCQQEPASTCALPNLIAEKSPRAVSDS